MNNWWSGKTKPDIVSALKMAKALDVPLEWMIDESANFPPPADASPQETAVIKLIRALQIDEDEALRRLATPSLGGSGWPPVRVTSGDVPPAKSKSG